MTKLSTTQSVNDVTEDDIERQSKKMEAWADKVVARFLNRSPVYPIGLASSLFADYSGQNGCPVCSFGQVHEKYEAEDDHAICMGCGKATDGLQRTIDFVTRDLESSRRYLMSFRLSIIKFRPKGIGPGNRGARPGIGAYRAMLEMHARKPNRAR